MQDAYTSAEARTLFGRLGEVFPLAELKFNRRPLTRAQMITITEDAIVLLSDYYVHLPQKRKLYGVDPITRLRLLQDRLSVEPRLDPSHFKLPERARKRLKRTQERLAEEEFHREMTAIFNSLRDNHTIYVLPNPYRRCVAFLPILIERCSDGAGGAQYVVSKVAFEKQGPSSLPMQLTRLRGATVTHWNGVPIERAIARAGDLDSGANLAARRARGVERLTFRWLGLALRPDEDSVVLTYRRGRSRPNDLRLPWLVLRQASARPRMASPRRAVGEAGAPALATRAAIDEEGEWRRRLKQELFGHTEAPELRRPADFVAYRTVGDDFGYLRIHSFAVKAEDVDTFVGLVRNHLAAAAGTDGLIIDIRGNPGGDLGAAERLLQMLTPLPIQPERLEFIATEAAATLAREYLQQNGHPDDDGTGAGDRFAQRLKEVRGTAAPYMPCPPVDPPEAYNAIGQVYQGPIVLLTDALTYSASDVFAAGFQDHELGDVLGTDPQTGGGGGNPWPRDQIKHYAGEKLARLPGDASFDVTVRRTTRVLERAGLPLEDLGVEADECVTPTRDDVLDGSNGDLIAKAIGRLRQQPARLRATYETSGRRFRLEAVGVDRVDVFVDGAPIGSVRAERLKDLIPVPEDEPDPRTASFLGYSAGDGNGNGRPVVAYRWTAADEA